MYFRQPIVAVLGHVDHGKTTLLDYIRGGCVAAKEAGAITQHIGATEVPIETVKEICGNLLKGKEFKIPGLLFIDTPGHFAFTTLRARGGALADLAILVVDINEGIMEQTKEAVAILKKYKTPFVIAANKIDLIDLWRKKEGVISKRLEEQNEMAKKDFDKKFYRLVEQIYDLGFSSDRYDRIRDFTRNVAIVPISAKNGEGIDELIMILIGLSQKFLEENLICEEKEAEGTVLEVKEEKGLGTTIDVIIYNGVIKEGDEIIVAGKKGAIITTVRALLKPKPLDEIRAPEEKFRRVKIATAACGVKIVAPRLEDAFAGAPIKVLKNVEEDMKKIEEEMKINIETTDEGVVLKADALGSLEAISLILKEKNIPLRKAEIGDISKRDIFEAKTNEREVNRAIIGFNVKVLPEVEDSEGVEIITDSVVYHLIEKLEKWRENKRKEEEEKKRMEITYPGMILFLPNCTFRLSKPAIIGVRVLAGEIRPEQHLIREDGKKIGKIKSIQMEKRSLDRATKGMEVAISIEGATVGRQIKPEQILFVDLSENDIQKLLEEDLSIDEKDVLEKVIKIKRKHD
ncbi:MAG: translation initiation factor IF-2 [Thermoplasmatales archaeon]|nr:translation initiation factor IF-2 [Thermoplasmatales archaeon]